MIDSEVSSRCCAGCRVVLMTGGAAAGAVPDGGSRVPGDPLVRPGGGDLRPSDGDVVGQHGDERILDASAMAGRWLQSEDQAVRPGDGYVRILDRSKDIIILAGESGRLENVTAPSRSCLCAFDSSWSC